MNGKLATIVLLHLSCLWPAFAQTTAFTYQGSLKDGATTANGNYDFEFALFDALSGGAQLGSTQTRNSVAVANGIFSVKLDFGSQFPGASRFLEIRVRLTGQPGITTLSPRQQVDSAPYSVKTLNADNATNATQLGGVAANQYVVTTDPRMTDARSPTAGSANYIQNTAVQQASSNFNVTGSGVVGGNLSIGTQTSQSPLTILTGTGFGLTHTNGTATVGTYVNSNGGWLGTRTNHPLYFFTNNSFEQMTIATNGNVGIGTTTPTQPFEVNGISSLGGRGGVYGFLLGGASPGPYPSLAFNAFYNGNLNAYQAGVAGYGGIFQFQNGDGKFGFYSTTASVPAGGSHTFTPRLVINNSGDVGIGTTNPIARLDVNSPDYSAVQGVSSSDGVRGINTGPSGAGIHGISNGGTGIAGFFEGSVIIQGILNAGGCVGCSPPSDRRLKANFLQVNNRSILNRLAALPIQTWNYKSEGTEIRHIGAMAQDFHTAFGYGAKDSTLETVDATGVIMASIQSLYQMMKEKDQQIARLSKDVRSLRAQLTKQRRGNRQPRR